MHVRFPRAIRSAYPIGTRFRVYAKLTDKEGGNPFLHTITHGIMRCFRLTNPDGRNWSALHRNLLRRMVLIAFEARLPVGQF